MDRTRIARVMADDIPALDTALRALAAHLGDAYETDIETLAFALCGPAAPCLALLATRDRHPVGAVLAAPVFSTMRGGAGLFVSDLWVAEEARGQGLGRRLLARTLKEGARCNAGRFLKLSVYHDNPEARAAYDSLGFTAHADETAMFLTGAPLSILKETP